MADEFELLRQEIAAEKKAEEQAKAEAYMKGKDGPEPIISVGPAVNEVKREIPVKESEYDWGHVEAASTPKILITMPDRHSGMANTRPRNYLPNQGS